MEARGMIKRHEGKNKKGHRHMPYICPAGKTTIGWGRNLTDRGISEDEAELMLRNDIRDSKNELSLHFGFFDRLDEVRQMALIDMHFNMGYTKLSWFKKMIKAFYRDDYEAAADEAMDSAWYQQVKGRGVEVVAMIRTGEL